MKKDTLKYFLSTILVVIVSLLAALIFLYPKQGGELFLNKIGVWFYSSNYSSRNQKSSLQNQGISQLGMSQNSDAIFGNQKVVDDSPKNSKKGLIESSFVQYKEIATSAKIWSTSLDDSLKSLKNHFSTLVIGYIPEPSAGLLLGMIFGGKSTLSDELEHFFEVTGMLHILSASGYNVGLIVGLAQQFWRRFCTARLATFLILLSLLSYVVLADATPSVVRAGLMSALQILATQVFHRRVQAYWLLLLSVLTMVWWNGEYLTSISFQLSVSACLGLILWSWALGQPEIYDFSVGDTFFKTKETMATSSFDTIGTYLKDAVLMTFSAQSLSWAIQIGTFQTLSLVSLLANPATIWLTPWLTTGGVFFIFGAWLLNHFLLGQVFILPIFAWMLVFLSQLLLSLIQFFGQWEGGVLRFSSTQPRWFIPAWWMTVFLAAFLIKRHRSLKGNAWYVT